MQDKPKALDVGKNSMLYTRVIQKVRLQGLLRPGKIFCFEVGTPGM
jgi:hypothetical protein